ncbi:MAG: hypothetical protein ACI8S6_001070 [Myxococcota bacterium]|jgi:hypothetical protein
MIGMMMMLSIAQADVSVSIDEISVDGMAIRQLSCQLERGGLFASAMVVGALSAQKAGLDACAPQGAAFTVSWTWAEGTTVASVAGSVPDKEACIRAALLPIQPPTRGQCVALILTGEPTAAAAAADQLQAAAGSGGK